MNTLESMTQADLIALVLKQQAALTARSNGKLTCKVSEKGAVSVYGLGRFPVTLYASQWQRLFNDAKAINAFIDANKASLATKE
jgi:hypothetical protein